MQPETCTGVASLGFTENERHPVDSVPETAAGRSAGCVYRAGSGKVRGSLRFGVFFGRSQCPVTLRVVAALTPRSSRTSPSTKGRPIPRSRADIQKAQLHQDWLGLHAPNTHRSN